MPHFEYTARDSTGRASTGTLQAADSAELRNLLRVDDLYLTRFKQTGKTEIRANGAKPSFFVSKPKPRDMVVLVRQMATLVRANVPLVEGLTILEKQIEKPQLREVMVQLREGVTEGRSLHSVMQRHPDLFNPVTLALIDAGEATGTLGLSLTVAAEFLDRDESLRAKVKGAMTYPKIVVVAAIGTVALMLSLVVPTFKTVYAEFHGTLPRPTQTLIALSDTVTHYWWAILALILAAWYGIREYRKTPVGQRLIDEWSLRIPVIGAVLRKVAIARFTQTLAAGFRGGVPVLVAIQVAASTAGNSVIRDAAMGVAATVREGQPLAQELERCGEFPPLVTQMVRSGEATGNLDEMLDEINRYYDEDIKYAVDKMTKLIEPVMTFVVGGIVAFVLIALYMPVFSLGKTVLGKH